MSLCHIIHFPASFIVCAEKFLSTCSKTKSSDFLKLSSECIFAWIGTIYCVSLKLSLLLHWMNVTKVLLFLWQLSAHYFQEQFEFVFLYTRQKIICSILFQIFSIPIINLKFKSLITHTFLEKYHIETSDHWCRAGIFIIYDKLKTFIHTL